MSAAPALPKPQHEASSGWRKGATLPLFLALSFLAHAATFVLFQVAYPRRVTLPQSSPEVYLLTPSTPDRAVFLRWIDSEDPALVAAVARAEPPHIHDVTYRPSYATIRTPPRIPVPAPETMPFPSAREPLALVQSLPSGDPAPKTLSRPTPASLRVSGALAGRKITKEPIFTATASKPVCSSEYLIGVTDRGEVRFCFLQRSSGEARVDDAAEAQLVRTSFESTTAEMTWGMVTIDWADGAYPSKAASAPSRKTAPTRSTR